MGIGAASSAELSRADGCEAPTHGTQSRRAIDVEWIELARVLAAARDFSSGTDIPVRRAWDSDETDRNWRLHRIGL